MLAFTLRSLQSNKSQPKKLFSDVVIGAFREWKNGHSENPPPLPNSPWVGGGRGRRAMIPQRVGGNRQRLRWRPPDTPKYRFGTKTLQTQPTPLLNRTPCQAVVKTIHTRKQGAAHRSPLSPPSHSSRPSEAPGTHGPSGQLMPVPVATAQTYLWCADSTLIDGQNETQALDEECIRSRRTSARWPPTVFMRKLGSHAEKL